jgi:hypothetical protein
MGIDPSSDVTSGFDIGLASPFGIDPSTFRNARRALAAGFAGAFGGKRSIEDTTNDIRAGFDPTVPNQPGMRAGNIDPNLTTPPKPDPIASASMFPRSPLGDMSQEAWRAANPAVGRRPMLSPGEGVRATTGGATADSMAPGSRSIETPPARGSGRIWAGTGADPRLPGFGRPGVGDWKSLLTKPQGEAESYSGPGSSSYRSTSGGTVSQSDVESLPWEQRPESWKTGRYEEMAYEAAKRAPMAGVAAEAWKSSIQQHTEERIRREYLAQSAQAHDAFDDEARQIMSDPTLPDKADPKKLGMSKEERLAAAKEREKQRLADIERAHAITAMRGNPFGRGYYPQTSFGGLP